MAKQTSKSGLMGKYGDRLRKAHENHRQDETEFSNFGELPPGIENGVAQLVECKFDQYKTGDFEGEYFFYAAGVVQSPEYYDGVKIQGRRTSIMEPLCDTPNRSRQTVDAHLSWIYNELRKLEVDTASMGVEDLEATVAALKESQPYFSFRTWRGDPTPQYPNPRTSHTWNGVVNYDDAHDPLSDAVDNTEVAEATPSNNGRPTTTPKAPTPTRKAPVSKAPQTPKTPAPPARPATKAPQKATPPEESFDDQGDLDTLATLADAGDENAAMQLSQQLLSLGLTEDQITGVDSWTEAVALVGTGEEEAAEVEFSPEAGEVFLYSPVDPKTKKPGKAIQVEVISVNTGDQTVTLKNLDTNKMVVNPTTKKVVSVSWDELSGQ